MMMCSFHRPHRTADVQVSPTAALTVAVALLPVLTGCGYQSGSRGFKGSAHTYVSSEHLPATLTLVDTRTGEVVWTMDIPAGKQLVTRFSADAGTDPVDRPDRLEYAVMDAGDRYGRLRSVVSVPNAASRRWELTYRSGPEFATAGKKEYSEFESQPTPWWWTEMDGEYQIEPADGSVSP